jgi:beta-barrel assembly-enhancing protease
MRIRHIFLSAFICILLISVKVVAQPSQNDSKLWDDRLEGTEFLLLTDDDKKIQTQQQQPKSSDNSHCEQPQIPIDKETKNPADREEAKISSEERARQEKLAQGDRLYLAGNFQAATQLYREAKQPFTSQPSEQPEKPTPIYEPDRLSPGARVFWRTYQQGSKQKMQSKILAPLELLVKKYPEFIPAHLHYAEALRQYEKPDEAIQILQNAIAQYPNEPDLLKAKIASDDRSKKYIDASITARQFALFNPDRPEAKEFTQLADKYLERYKSHLNSELTTNAIGNVLTGTLGYALTGNIFGPISAVQTSILLMQGESAVGEDFAKDATEQIPMMKDEEVIEYVNSIGQKLAGVAGRHEFKYNFYIIMDDRVNAFALPGGKIFLNAGAIMKTNSEAELAGLLAHELSHTVLSHSFQLITQGNLTANVTQYIPYVGGLSANLIVFNYSRDMERQADTFGTKILTASDYAADGMHNLMNLLKEEEAKKKEKDAPPPAWLSTHPDTDERIKNLENLIVQNNFNRYAYEGVTKHQEIQNKVQKLWQEFQKTDEYKELQRQKGEEEDLMQLSDFGF